MEGYLIPVINFCTLICLVCGKDTEHVYNMAKNPDAFRCLDCNKYGHEDIVEGWRESAKQSQKITRKLSRTEDLELESKIIKHLIISGEVETGIPVH